MLHEWVDRHVERTGPVEVVKDRPWSYVLKVPTATGPVWFKENRGATRYEAPLVAALARWLPDRVLTPIAIDAERGWSLLPDGGPILREVALPKDLQHWERLLATHAQFQRDVAPHAGELVALGVPDHRPAAFVGNVARLPASDALTASMADLLALNDTLAASPVPASLQHDDLHDGNVFADGRVFDWGDSSVGHPFGVLLVASRVAADRFEVSDGDPLVLRLRDAYLEPWSDLADRPTMLAEVRAAVQLGKVGRSLSWQRALADADEDGRSEWGDAVTGWLDELREPGPLADG